MAFRLFSRKTDTPTAPAPKPRVVIEGYRPPPPPPPKQTPVSDPLKRQLIYQGLHDDINPSSNVRTGQMTCPSCNAEFRFFKNSDGKAAIMKCPGCGKSYRV